ncbi:MAG: hypothetical protein LQ340_004651 [Diploschistes diacapsis]|nr:MAG: hypothetical protein LQ340_004651 [Diploschistes diacapsis]
MAIIEAIQNKTKFPDALKQVWPNSAFGKQYVWAGPGRRGPCDAILQNHGSKAATAIVYSGNVPRDIVSAIENPSTKGGKKARRDFDNLDAISARYAEPEELYSYLYARDADPDAYSYPYAYPEPSY